MTAPLCVIMTPNAADDLTASWNYLRERSPRTADEWLTGIRHTICTLAQLKQLISDNSAISMG